MKAVILAGGRGTRISEESHLRPKPMITIGEHPILWHIMKTYAYHGINEFIICLGYKGYVIKEYFSNYSLHRANAVTFDLKNGSTSFGHEDSEPWKITLVETGIDTQTGGRIKRIAPWLDDEEDFCLTYGDGLADIDITEQLKFHAAHGGKATVAAVAPTARFGVIGVEENRVTEFLEKPHSDGSLINGGFFVLSKSVIDHIDGDSTIWERDPMDSLVKAGELFAFLHSGFWQPMDTLRERDQLENLWSSGQAPWKVW